MADEKEFIGGMYPKKPLKDFIKCQISIKRKEFVEWFKTTDKDEEWINIDIKESKSGKWYAEKITGNQKKKLKVVIIIPRKTYPSNEKTR